jgi:hypothetical protein
MLYIVRAVRGKIGFPVLWITFPQIRGRVHVIRKNVEYQPFPPVMPVDKFSEL